MFSNISNAISTLNGQSLNIQEYTNLNLQPSKLGDIVYCRNSRNEQLKFYKFQTLNSYIPTNSYILLTSRILLKQMEQGVRITYDQSPCISKERKLFRFEKKEEGCKKGLCVGGWPIQVGHWRKGLGPIRWQRQNSKRRRRTWLPAISQLSIHEALRRSCPTRNYRCIVCIIRPWYMHSRGIDRRRRTRTIPEIRPRHRNREFFDGRARNALSRTVILLLKTVPSRRVP